MAINTTLIASRYPESFTLLDAINDPNISENLEKYYVPEVEVRDSIFIKKDLSIAVTNDGPKRIRFIYLNAAGKNITNPDSSYIQIPISCKGFLARLSISRNLYTPENLSLDYFIDLSKINYQIDSVIMRENNDITMHQVLHFNNLEFRDYPRIDFDETIRNFISNREILFNQYFRY